VTINCANALTLSSVDRETASLPAAMSTSLAVTTMAAICASLTPCADAVVSGNNNRVAPSTTESFMIDSSMTVG
jgi:hypothetical protein